MADDAKTDSAEAANDSQPKRRGRAAANAEPSEPSQADLEKEHAEHQGAGDALPVVDLKVFAARHHLPADQLAAFASHAKAHHAGRRTIPEWNDLLAGFQTKAVK